MGILIVFERRDSTWHEDGCVVEPLVSREVEPHLQTAVVASPAMLLVTVEGLVVDEVGVVVLEDGGERHAAGFVPVLDSVGADPVEGHLVSGVGD